MRLFPASTVIITVKVGNYIMGLPPEITFSATAEIDGNHKTVAYNATSLDGLKQQAREYARTIARAAKSQHDNKTPATS